MNKEMNAQLKAHNTYVKVTEAIWEKMVEEQRANETYTDFNETHTHFNLPLEIGYYYMAQVQELKEGLAVNEFRKVDTLGQEMSIFIKSINYIELDGREFEVSKGNNGDVYLMRIK
tara:strand:- start:28 stop:375 length:348 start_codon:yes stop_codon:yes gene_type:complete